MTLIAVYGSDGLVGRCDAGCHDAKGPVCVCVCGGVNHGVGLAKAFTQTVDEVGEWLEFFRSQGLTAESDLEWASGLFE